MTSNSLVHLRAGNLGRYASTAPTRCSAENLRIDTEGCPRLTVTGGLLPINGQIALGYLRQRALVVR